MVARGPGAAVRSLPHRAPGRHPSSRAPPRSACASVTSWSWRVGVCSAGGPWPSGPAVRAGRRPGTDAGGAARVPEGGPSLPPWVDTGPGTPSRTAGTGNRRDRDAGGMRPKRGVPSAPFPSCSASGTGPRPRLTSGTRRLLSSGHVHLAFRSPFPRRSGVRKAGVSHLSGGQARPAL